MFLILCDLVESEDRQLDFGMTWVRVHLVFLRSNVCDEAVNVADHDIEELSRASVLVMSQSALQQVSRVV